MNRVQIKICGITSVDDAKACADLGADMVGLNFHRRSPRCIEPAVGRRIVDALPNSIEAVGVFADESVGEVRETAQSVGLKRIQLHGNTPTEECQELATEFRVIRAFQTGKQFRPEDVTAFEFCDALLDAHHPALRGGTGQTCDWPAARATRAFTWFLILSGGLNTRNVGEAIETVGPHAVDVCSGVESAPGVKDHRAVKNFIAASRSK